MQQRPRPWAVIAVICGASACGRLGYDPVVTGASQIDGGLLARAAPLDMRLPGAEAAWSPVLSAAADGSAVGPDLPAGLDAFVLAPSADTATGADSAERDAPIDVMRADIRGAEDSRSPLEVAAPDAGASAPDAGAPDSAPCLWPPASGLLAEWLANGDDSNAVACSPWQAQRRGAVPYGPGRNGQAWQFRSTQTSVVGDPDYVEVPGSAGRVYQRFTLDTWINQTGFNNYAGSNRTIVSTGFKEFNLSAGEWMFYVHENRTVGFLLRMTPQPGAQVGVDYVYLQCGDAAGVPLDTWLRYTVTFDGTALSCYENAVLKFSAPVGTYVPMPAAALTIGRNYPGDMDAVRIFSRALTASEIAQTWP